MIDTKTTLPRPERKVRLLNIYRCSTSGCYSTEFNIKGKPGNDEPLMATCTKCKKEVRLIRSKNLLWEGL